MVATSIPWNWGYWSYYNPYAVQPFVVNNVTYDYSQPLAATTVITPDTAPVAAGEPVPADLAAEAFDAARDAFYAGDYDTALARVNEALAHSPGDATLHEFRALCWFATGQYKEAAAAIYAVLSAGPGWDWTTLSSLYPAVDVYTEQLRALEDSVRSQPQEAQSRFLLAYHYLTCGQSVAAARQLAEVLKINPQDTLSSQLLASLTPAKEPAQPAPAPAPAGPIAAGALVGTWQAAQPDGTAITLDLGPDANYKWTVARDGQQQAFSGNYTLADNLLVLNENGNPTMVGQVSSTGNDQFNFRLPGAAPSDPGLTFQR